MTLPVWLTIPRMIVGSIVTLGVIWLVLSIRADIREGGYRQGVADTIQAERLCNEGSVCADLADQRFRDSERAVEKAKQDARERERMALAHDMQLLDEARAREAKRAATATADALEWRARYERALATDQSCAAFSAAPIPCPVAP